MEEVPHKRLPRSQNNPKDFKSHLRVLLNKSGMEPLLSPSTILNATSKMSQAFLKAILSLAHLGYAFNGSSFNVNMNPAANSGEET